jgi:rhodanese-related sulfurtransferase
MPTNMATYQGHRQIKARGQFTDFPELRDRIPRVNLLRLPRLMGRPQFVRVLAWLLLVSGAVCGASDLDEIEADIAKSSSVAQMSSAEVTALLAAPKGVALFDVREPKEFAVSHLSGAIRLDPDTKPEVFMQAYGQLLGQQPVVFYCSVGRRSSALAERVNALSAAQAPGSTPVANLRGGIFRWANEARPLQDARGETSLVHPYSFYWGRMLTDKEQISYTPRD